MTAFSIRREDRRQKQILSRETAFAFARIQTRLTSNQARLHARWGRPMGSSGRGFPLSSQVPHKLQEKQKERQLYSEGEGTEQTSCRGPGCRANSWGSLGGEGARNIPKGLKRCHCCSWSPVREWRTHYAQDVGECIRGGQARSKVPSGPRTMWTPQPCPGTGCMPVSTMINHCTSVLLVVLLVTLLAGI